MLILIFQIITSNIFLPNYLKKLHSYSKFDQNETLESLKKKLNEVEKNLGKNNEIFFTPDIKMMKSKTTHQKNARNPSPPHANDTAKKNIYNPSPSPYNK